MRRRRAVLVVLDGVGIGSASDAHKYGDSGANTLAHVIESRALSLPHLSALGLGNVIPLRGIERVDYPLASYGILRERSPGKDTVTGHWEMMGIILDRAFPVFPDGFPDDIMEEFVKTTGWNYLWNRPASGTEIIEALGEEHINTKRLIIYTSADSVFQVAAHVDVVAEEELYRICGQARRITNPYGIVRVIARPFAGVPGEFYRTGGRRDYSLLPPGENTLDILEGEGVKTLSLGKVSEMFSGKGFAETVKTKNNREGMRLLKDTLSRMPGGFIFANLNDYDMLYGHRNDVEGFGKALEEFDRFIPSLLEMMHEEDILIITADHGNDPTLSGTDHTRENVFILIFRRGREGVNLGERDTFASIGATILSFFQIPVPFGGMPFLEVL